MSFGKSKLPLEPSQDVFDWASRKFLIDHHALLYRDSWYRNPLTGDRENCVEVKCGICGGVMKLDKAYSNCCHHGYYSSHAPYGFYDLHGEPVTENDTILCPICGGGVKAKYFSGVHDSIRIAE